MGLFLLSSALVSAQSVTSVSFTSDSLSLNGSFYLPAGQGPFPAVVLVHGSGPNDRYQTLPLNSGNAQCLYPGLYPGTVKNFEDIAIGLQDSGIAVFTYDKRTFTHGSTLDAQKIVIEDFIRDGSAALNYLASRTEVDTSLLYIVGHSQGATLAPYIALQNTHADGIISLAGPAIPLDTILPDQVRYIYRNCADSTQGEQIAQQFYQAFQSIRAGTWPANQALSGAYAPFWLSWLQKTDSVVDAFQRAGLPYHFVQGSDDFNVPVENANRFGKALNLAAEDLAIYPGINHYLTTASNINVSQAIIDTMVYWIKKAPRVGLVEAADPNYYYYTKNGRLFVETDDDAEVFQLRLYSLDGREIYNTSFKGRQSWALPRPGIYIGRLENDRYSLPLKIQW